MLGAVIIVIAMVLVLPVAIMFGGAVWSALLGWTFGGDDQTPAEPSAEAATSE